MTLSNAPKLYVCLEICLQVLSGPELCPVVPTWIDLMLARDFCMKLAKPNPMFDEMNKTRDCLKEVYYLYAVVYKYEYEHLDVEELSSTKSSCSVSTFVKTPEMKLTR